MIDSRMKRRIRVGCMILIGLLYVASVPWYRQADAPLRLWFGLPDWVAVALVCYVAVAVVNAVAWTVSEVSDEVAPADPQRQDEAGR